MEADADVVAFLHREAHRILKSPEFRAGSAEAHARYARVEREAELIIGKNRAGPERTVKLWCLPACSTMADGGGEGGGEDDIERVLHIQQPKTQHPSPQGGADGTPFDSTSTA